MDTVIQYVNKNDLHVILTSTFEELPDAQPEDPEAVQYPELKSDYAPLEYDPEPVLVRRQYLITGEIRVEGERYIQGWIISEPSAAEYLSYAVARRDDLSRIAGVQLTALNARISALDWLINIQTPEDQEEAGEEYVAPTDADIAELAALKIRYTKWNSYTIKLGKVQTQPAWPMEPVWPVMPDLYV